MNEKFGLVKLTLWGGLLFMVPLTIFIVLVMKIFQFMRVLATPIGNLIAADSVAGVAVADLITVFIILLVCYVAGRIAMSSRGKKLYKSLDDKLLLFFPGYSFVKSMSASVGKGDVETALEPVLVKLDDMTQIGFEVERDDKGWVIVFLPGSPDPWSGSVAYVDPERIESMNTTFHEVVSSMRKAGQGTAQLIN
jgi:uncharacterized membrane protein